MDYFALLGLPRQFSVDIARLESRYRELQREVHPDRFAVASGAEQRASVEMAARVNDAYRTLRSPLARARYLLELSGIDAQLETNTAMPAEFLNQQMVWRESLAEAVEHRDGARLRGLGDEASHAVKTCHAELESLFDAGPADVRAASQVRQLMFLEKLREEILSAQDCLPEA